MLWAKLFSLSWVIDTQMSLSVSSFIIHAHIYIILFSCVFKYFIINSKRKIIQVGEDSEKNIHGRITRVWKSHFMKEALRITVKNTIFSSK